MVIMCCVLHVGSGTRLDVIIEVEYSQGCVAMNASGRMEGEENEEARAVPMLMVVPERGLLSENPETGQSEVEVEQAEPELRLPTARDDQEPQHQEPASNNREQEKERNLSERHEGGQEEGQRKEEKGEQEIGKDMEQERIGEDVVSDQGVKLESQVTAVEEEHKNCVERLETVEQQATEQHTAEQTTEQHTAEQTTEQQTTEQQSMELHSSEQHASEQHVAEPGGEEVLKDQHATVEFTASIPLVQVSAIMNVSNCPTDELFEEA